MQVEFFDPYPHEKPKPALRALLVGARRINAAIAFVTRGGTSVLHEFLSTHSPQDARLVASVRYPSDLSEVARLADKMTDGVAVAVGLR